MKGINMTRFTKQQLIEIRNKIDIDWLIKEKLYLQQKYNRLWRFCCPICQQFNTATQKKTNLARCFNCEKNFNTIDLVIYTKKLNFEPAVNWLYLLLERKKPINQAKKPLTKIDKKILGEKREKGREEIKKIKFLLKKSIETPV
jgi:hypothetical protein